ncbi:MAG: aminotransferase class I/II-fold pyridoxal phosphate-dependent enzyme [Planctomycetota bacterium]|nr:aminotransferase class I/II-fold pyridoxal phosphate-dependent enzyme [Planctomycetota bacterium]MDG2143892.1 aminotransferase class I/II-fold pyridoxal phosphate-dependent enzyme [Planctomycetota bacterium]
MTPDPANPLIPASNNRPGDDPIFTLHGMATRRAAAGEDILNATLGALVEDDGSLAVMPSVHEALRNTSLDRASAYAPISGPPEFLAAVERDVFHGHGLQSKCIAVATPGGSGAIYNAVTNFLEPGQKALTSSYYWAPYDILTGLSDRGICTFNMFGADGNLDLVSFEESLHALIAEQGRALVILNSPCHNPTGYSFNEDEWRAVCDIMAKAADEGPVTLLIDFAYAKYAPEGDADWRDHVARILPKVPTIVAWSASKAFAQYGARVGALIALHEDDTIRDRIANAMGFTCRGTWSNCNHHGMIAIGEVLRDDKLHAAWDKDRARLVELLDARVVEFNRLAAKHNLHYPRYEGGFFVAVFSDNPQVTIKHMQDAGVFIVPLQGAVRVGLCATPKSKIPRLVEALAAGIEAAKQIPAS